MKKYPLGVQIWIVFAIMTAGISLLIILFVPSTLRVFFTNQIYLTIEDAQHAIISRGLNASMQDPIERGQERQNIRTVEHMMIMQNGKVFPRNGLPLQFIQTVQNQAMAQQTDTYQYVSRIKDESIFYVISKVDARGQQAYLFSYMWDTYQKQLVRELYKKMLSLILIILFISWIPSFWLINSVSKPIVQIGKRVKRIASRDWHEPVITDRKDEIGQLVSSIEWMRQKLVQQDEAQQTFLQHISHELKTPVMVIRSYAEAIGDGVFPKGDLPGSVKVIDEEAQRLEKRIHDLLYLTKLDYMDEHGPKREKFQLKALIEQAAERLKWRRKELDWKFDLISADMWGDPEQWSVALENVLDNQIRYAATSIELSMEIKETSTGKRMALRIWNDGPPVPEQDQDSLFQPFTKGKNGQFGLGLAIVKRIVNLHQSSVWIRNENEGVSYYFIIPMNP